MACVTHLVSIQPVLEGEIQTAVKIFDRMCVCMFARHSDEVESHVIAGKVLVFQSLPVELLQLFPIDDLDAAKKLTLQPGRPDRMDVLQESRSVAVLLALGKSSCRVFVKSLATKVEKFIDIPGREAAIS